MSETTVESEFVGHEPCPLCGSGNNLARYSDGHAYCFTPGCGHYEKGADDDSRTHDSNRANKTRHDLLTGDFAALPKRGITETTCRKFGYMVGTFANSAVQIAPFHDEKGNLQAQHLRFPNKDFIWLGESKLCGLWGQQLWRDGGKMVVITEGEIDAMSISQLQDNRWPVVSIRSGAAGAKKDIAKALPWLERFENVVFALDMDEAGREATAECAPLLTPGKAKVWNLPLKDANEMLVAGRTKELMDAVWGAKVYRPDGIVASEDTWDLLMEENSGDSIPYPWAKLQSMEDGMRLGEIVTFCAGSGIGKSQVCRELTIHLTQHNQKVGVIALEENVKRTVRGLVSILVNRPIHKDSVRRSMDVGVLKKAWDYLTGKVLYYDHRGVMDADSIIQRMRFLYHACGVRYIVLDHVSIMVSGDATGDERRNIDNLMTQLRKLVSELNFCLLLVSHLKRPDGKPLEEGGRTSLSLLRGSGAIGQISDTVIGQERNQQDEERANITLLRILKARFTGETGEAGELEYDSQTGRLSELGYNVATDAPAIIAGAGAAATGPPDY